MENDKLIFYNVSEEYIDYLTSIDDKVMYNKPEKHQRPYVGFILMLNDIKYLVPLSSQIRKTNDVTMVIPDRITELQKINNHNNNIKDKIATIKFNCMIPVFDDIVKKIDLDNFVQVDDLEYRDLLMKEILFCSENKVQILNKAKKTQSIYMKNKPYMKQIIESCVNFFELEKAMINYRTMREVAITINEEADDTIELNNYQ